MKTYMHLILLLKNSNTCPNTFYKTEPEVHIEYCYIYRDGTYRNVCELILGLVVSYLL